MPHHRINFRTLKQQACFQTILDRYGFSRHNARLRHFILCPFHREREASCLIDHARNRFHCFGCGEGGSIIDFVARMEHCTIAHAAEIIVERCHVAADDDQVAHGKAETAGMSAADNASPACEALANLPLRTPLQLDPAHPYLAERGVRPDIIEQFGLGYCDAGTMRGRIAIPIHDEAGRLVAYAGRWAAKDVPKDRPRYLLPRGFHKQLVLFNLYRVKGAHTVTIVESYWSVFRLAALGVPALALMGRELCARQLELLAAAGPDRVQTMLDGDQAGRTATAKIVPQLARRVFIKNIELPDSMKPHSAPGALLCYLLGLS